MNKYSYPIERIHEQGGHRIKIIRIKDGMVKEFSIASPSVREQCVLEFMESMTDATCDGFFK